MISRRTLLLVLAAATLSAWSARAAERLPYAPEAFAAAVKSGTPILVHVTAPWCGECKLQKPIVARLAGEPDFAGLTIFEVDFDSQKAALRDLHVQMQSTLLAFRNGKEVARLVGDTRAKSIEDLMRKAL